MADSHTAAIVQFINALSIAVAGPPPLPLNAALPYVTVREVIASELESLTGKSNLTRTVMQVECWSKDYEMANSIRESIKGPGDGSGLLGAYGAVGTRNVQGPINHIMDAELYHERLEIHQLITRYLVWWGE